jgi:hypothetical protein
MLFFIIPPAAGMSNYCKYGTNKTVLVGVSVKAEEKF